MRHRTWVESGSGRQAYKRRARCSCGWRSRFAYPARDYADAVQDAREHKIKMRQS